MRILPFIFLISLSAFSTSCVSYIISSESLGFKVRTVDEISGKPVSGVKVERMSVHYTGRKSLNREVGLFGETDHRGILNIGKLNMHSRHYTFSFEKRGYRTVDFLNMKKDGIHVGLIINDKNELLYHVEIMESEIVTQSNNDFIGNPIKHSESMVVEIPMRRR